MHCATGLSLVIRELSSYVGGHGSVVWNAAYILGQYILCHTEDFQGKSCIEVGMLSMTKAILTLPFDCL